MTVKKSDLCTSERRLIELLQDLYFGRIEDLWFREGKPVFDPPPRVIKTLSMTADAAGREEAHSRDFDLKRPMIRLLLAIRESGNGKIRVIHVRHGLPITAEVLHPLGLIGEPK